MGMRVSSFDLTPYKAIYPYTGHYLDRNGMKLHYLDEGQAGAEPLVMLHGNPTWSLYFRALVDAFRGDYRVVVPDHMGCGLSDVPGDDRYEYRLEQRVDDLDALLLKVGIQNNITLVLHDWGGMIGMAYATRYPERIRRIVLLNTGAFFLPEAKPFPLTLRICRDTPLGSLLVRGLNAFSTAATWWCATEKGLSSQLAAAYRAPYNSWHNRIATLRFVQDIPLAAGDPSYQLVKNVQDRLGQFADRPVLICWGEKDFVFDGHFLKGWRQYWPKAEVHTFPRAGHYVLEDAADRIIPLMDAFLKRNPL
jgi:pimeloyl-ACP methyl ester carboxylesterase